MVDIAKFINSPDRVVSEMLDGLVALDPHLQRISGYNVVVRADVAAMRDRQVALISGGGSGHEPAHAGFVGAGMLSAAVAGEVFTSPSAESVYAAIRAVAGKPGVLLIVKNYTGDRLNFGLAAEMARGQGIPVEMMIVGDDVALDESRKTAGARGIAGTVLIHKVAGAVAAEGAGLAQVKAVAEAAAASLGSFGVSVAAGISPVTGKPTFVLGEGEMELGVGIHGEPGVRRAPIAPVDALVEPMLDRIVAIRQLRQGSRVVVMVNNMGATTTMELAIAARHALAVLEQRGLIVERIYAGTFLTSLDMAGISLSLLAVDDERLRYLDAPTTAMAWPNVPRQPPAHADDRTLHLAQPSADAARLASGHREISEAGERLRGAIEAACAALIEAESRLTELDRQVGDGDLGISLERGARAIRHALDRYPLDDLSGTLEALGHTVREAVGGTSGPLYGVLFLRIAHVLRSSPNPNPNPNPNLDLIDWAGTLDAACAAVSELGGASAGDRTMLDALLPFAESLRQAALQQRPIRDGLWDAVNAAERGAEQTAQMVPRRGRSSYIGERALGHPDPGAVAVAIELRAVVQKLLG